MVAVSDHSPKALNNGRKVSKPLMEKKRRARINECLDELKLLMETYYTNYIRKRKLEKADILEMTVKHLRNLQKTQRGRFMDSKCVEYQEGFKSCLNGVHEFLLTADNSNGVLRFNVLRHLSDRLSGLPSWSSTADNDENHRMSSTEPHPWTPVPVTARDCNISLLGDPRSAEIRVQSKNQRHLPCSRNETHAPGFLNLQKEHRPAASQCYWRPW
ncbi:transcription factor HES-3-like [Brienomyrus brachyistius]|uniref:transcription factor HES-3-like n=1 Tax=Brienomyrus brachyistius TaxID=42636 RepID=UPI0020B1FF2D|nr:transcription factor HES-3-like [Brienomyrus brachyistius]